MKLILAGVALVASAQAGLFNARQCGQSCDVARRCTVGTYCDGGTCVGDSCPSVVNDQAGGECGVYTCNSDQWCNAGISCSDKSIEGAHCYYADQCYTGYKCENSECRLDTGKYDTNADVVEVTVTFPEELDEDGEKMVVDKFCEATATATGADQSFLSCSISKATAGRRLLMETYALKASTSDPATAKTVQANSQAIFDEVAVAVPQSTVSALALANLPLDPEPGSTPAPATDAPATDAPATMTPATNTPATSTPATNTPATNTPATSTPATATPATATPAPAPSGGSGSASDFTGCESCANAGFKWESGINDRGSCQSSDYTEGGCEVGKTNGDFYCVTDAEKCCYGCTQIRGAYFFNGQSACQSASTCTADIAGIECIRNRNDCAVTP